MNENAHTPGPKTVPEVLSAAADLLEKPGAWTTEFLARDSEGAEVDDPASADASCWCVAGALLRLAGYGDEYQAARKAVLHVVGGERVAPWNDAPGRTQAEVVAALREAAAKATGAPSHD